MRRRILLFAAALAVLVAWASPGVAPATAQSDVPPTPWGHPDLQGVWDFRTITPLERPAELGDRAFLTEPPRPVSNTL